MCGFVGFANLKENVIQNSNIIEKMNQTLSKRGPDEDGYYIEEHISMGHKRLIVIDPEGRKATNGRKIFLWRFYHLL
jgi:asparagine synthase (glutamine-hydrolysing)